MADAKVEAMEVAVSQPPLKKLKQARLPFKVISPKVGQQTEPLIPTTPPSNKKRKLSDTAPGPNKASKTPRNDENVLKTKKTAPKVSDADNEVSSSSEAEASLKNCIVKIERCKKTVNMDQFLRKPQQLEVSTTNSIDTCAVVDLTDSNDATSVGTLPEKPSCSEATSVGDKIPATESLIGSSEVCDTSSVLSKTVMEEKEVHCDSTESQDNNIDAKVENVSGSNNCQAAPTKKKLEDIFEEEATSLVDKEEGSSEIAPEGQKTDDDNESADENDSLNETGDSEKDLSTLSENSQKSPDDSLTEEQGTSPGGGTESETAKTPRTPASIARKAEKEAERLRKLQEREQLKLEKQKEKEEKERIRKEEKEKKEKEKEELRKKKELEKKEKTEQKEKERQEKLKQKEEEKKKKEEERLKKVEEKQKEVEEKQRQKEEKEKEKEEAKSKISEKQVTFFSSFFTKKEKDASSAKEEQTSGNFIQFEVKSDMRLAPHVRRQPLDTQLKQTLDTHISTQNPDQLYLHQLKTDGYKSGKGFKTWPNSEDDVIIMDDSDKPGKKLMKAKFLSFHENNRPAYRGTWSKKSKAITPRNPLALDKNHLDYEVDSDLEWEEEEPGESVSDSEGGEDEGGEPEDEEEEDGFFVPHGYLSEGEGCEDEDEDATPERMKARQLARAKAFDLEMKKKTELLKPVCTGCCWWEPDKASSPALDMLQKFKVVGFSSFPINPMCNKFEKVKKKTKKEDKKKLQPQNVPEEAIPDLVRLIHGNRWSVQKLIREFREFWRLKSSGLDPVSQSGSDKPDTTNEDDEADTSQNEDVGDTIKYSMSKRQVDKTIKEIAVYERRTTYPKSCWYVHNSVLEKTNLKDLSVPTQWVWVTKDPNKATPRTATPNATVPGATSGTASSTVERSPTPIQNVQKEGSIMKFTKPGISPKFPIISPKPLPAACSTPTTQGKASILSKFKQETPKRDSPHPKISPATLFLPIEKTDEVSSSDCVVVEAPNTIKPDKNQPTLLSLFKGGAVGTSSSNSGIKSSSPKTTAEVMRRNSLNSPVTTKNCVDTIKADSTQNNTHTIDQSQAKMVPGSAECPMEID